MINHDDLLPEEQAHPELCRGLATLYQFRPVEEQMLARVQGQLVTRQTPNAETSLQIEPSRRLSARRRTGWLMTAAALILALLGAGFAGPFSHWFGGSTSAPLAYAAINQSMQISNGVKLTAIKGYVDPKHLVLYFDAQMSSDLKSKYAGPLVSKSTIQGKDAKITWAVLAETTVNHGAIVVPSGGDIAGKTLQVIWHISEVELISQVPGSTPLFIKGDWTFRFSIPFHHEVQEPLQLNFPGVRPIPID